jgi:hypothetical protein
MTAIARRLSSLAFAALLVSAGAHMASATDDMRPVLDCKLAFDAIKETALALPGAETSEKPDWDMVHVKSRAGERGDRQKAPRETQTMIEG